MSNTDARSVRPGSTLALYVSACSPGTRSTRTPLSSGTNSIAYRMQYNGDDVIVVINRGDGTEQVGGLPAGTFSDLLGGGSVSGPSVSVPARSSMVLVAK